MAGIAYKARVTGPSDAKLWIKPLKFIFIRSIIRQHDVGPRTAIVLVDTT